MRFGVQAFVCLALGLALPTAALAGKGAGDTRPVPSTMAPDPAAPQTTAAAKKKPCRKWVLTPPRPAGSPTRAARPVPQFMLLDDVIEQSSTILRGTVLALEDVGEGVLTGSDGVERNVFLRHAAVHVDAVLEGDPRQAGMTVVVQDFKPPDFAEVPLEVGGHGLIFLDADGGPVNLDYPWLPFAPGHPAAAGGPPAARSGPAAAPALPAARRERGNALAARRAGRPPAGVGRGRPPGADDGAVPTRTSSRWHSPSWWHFRMRGPSRPR